MAKKKITPDIASPPSSSCLLICDDVLMGAAKGKHFLHGVISEIVVPRLPCVLGPYAAYVRLSNVHGGQKITLSFCRLAESDDELFKFEATSPERSDPVAAHTIILPIPAFVVKRPGRYIFEASHGGVPFATNAILINSVPKTRKKKS